MAKEKDKKHKDIPEYVPGNVIKYVGRRWLVIGLAENMMTIISLPDFSETRGIRNNLKLPVAREVEIVATF